MNIYKCIRSLFITVLLIVCVFSLNAFAGSYYVSSSSGEDWYDGLATAFDGVHGPWKTINKVNSHTFIAGDSILFKRGDIWYESLIVTSSGGTDAQITYSSYGAGNAPVINGARLVTGIWKIYNGNIWEINLSPEIISATQLFVDGERQTLARTTGWSSIDATSESNTYIYDESLNQANDYWVGTTVVIRPELWMIETRTVTKSSSIDRTIMWTPPTNWTPSNKYGYYMENKLALLDRDGEWYFDAITHTLYLQMSSGENPNNHTIEASILDYGIYSKGKSYITFSGLDVVKSAIAGIRFNGGSYNTIMNNTISQSKASGIYYFRDASHIRIEGNTVSEIDGAGYQSTVTGSNNTESMIGGSGIFLYKITDASVLNNTVSKIASDFDAVLMGYGIAGLIYDSEISGNVLSDIGYNGIFPWHGSHNVSILNNTLNRCVETLCDGGAVYIPTNVSTNIRYNWINDCTGNMDGTPYAGTKADGGVGVYLDGASSDNSIQYNVISGCTFSNGVQVNGGTNNRVQNNTLYNNYIGIYLGDTDAGLVHDNIITNNIIYAIDATQVLLYIKHFPSSAYSAGTLNHNLYYNNSKSDVIRYYDGSKTVNYTLSQWKSKNGIDSGNDANSLAADPVFVDASNGDFHLMLNSPCINSGLHAGLTSDFDGILVPQGIFPDMGAFEYSGTTVAYKNLAQEGALVCYPNPFCYKTTIKYQVKTTSKITLFVIDIYGRQVEIIYSGIQQPGKYILEWSPSGISPGFNFLRLLSGECSEVMKISVL
jgi:parallel beta-helix repeat protein